MKSFAHVGKYILLPLLLPLMLLLACLQVIQQATMTNTLLPQNSHYAHLVRRVGMRIAQVSVAAAVFGF